jgi:hypothetical protein
VGCSYNTLNYWYRWKRRNEDNEYAQLLPEFYSEGERQPRYWNKEDVAKLIQFKNSIPQGRGGLMGDVTQAYRRNQQKGKIKNAKGRKRKR